MPAPSSNCWSTGGCRRSGSIRTTGTSGRRTRPSSWRTLPQPSRRAHSWGTRRPPTHRSPPPGPLRATFTPTSSARTRCGWSSCRPRRPSASGGIKPRHFLGREFEVDPGRAVTDALGAGRAGNWDERRRAGEEPGNSDALGTHPTRGGDLGEGRGLGTEVLRPQAPPKGPPREVRQAQVGAAVDHILVRPSQRRVLVLDARQLLTNDGARGVELVGI